MIISLSYSKFTNKLEQLQGIQIRLPKNLSEAGFGSNMDTVDTQAPTIPTPC